MQLFLLQLFLGHNALVPLPISSGTPEGEEAYFLYTVPFQFQYINVVPSVKSIRDEMWCICLCSAFI